MVVGETGKEKGIRRNRVCGYGGFCVYWVLEKKKINIVQMWKIVGVSKALILYIYWCLTCTMRGIIL